MLNKDTVKVLYKRVDNILSNLSAQDWWRVNKNAPIVKKGEFTPSGRIRHYLPYSLSDETLQCLEILKLIKENMSKENEQLAKGLIMKYRLIAPKYIEDAHYYIKNRYNIEPVKILI